MRGQLAPTPPMGWNSWDTFGASINEVEVLEQAVCLADGLAAYGWQYLVVDIQWYEPTATSSIYKPFVPLAMDSYSRLVPALNRFPSSAGELGFGPLSQRVHDLGLKFGLHAMRGVPRQAVHQNTPILGSQVGARDIAATNSTCSWNTDMYGVNPYADGAQAYYDSVFALYAQWGVDFVKVDDALLPYAAGEIELIHRAIDRCGRDIVLSLSCGPLDPLHAEHVRAHAQMWRMSGDLWDTWPDVLKTFDLCRDWSPHVGAGSWPDADMLPLGRLALRSSEHGLGQRSTRLSRDEQVTLLTLWCIFRSPLMLGCDLREMDPWTLSLLTNSQVLEMLRTSHDAREVVRHEDLIVWVAAKGIDERYVAVFNTGFARKSFRLDPSVLGLVCPATVCDLWTGQNLGSVDDGLLVEVAGHGARLLLAEKHP